MPRAEQSRGLRAVVFVDTVGSTQVASELGDERWQRLLRRELEILRRLLKRHGGQEVDTAGDGLFAVFTEPAAAVRFAADATEAVREIGLEIRAGVHFGECELSDGHPGGIVVHTGARAMSTGGAGEVIVSQTVRDLVPGGNLRFADHGIHELKGVPGRWPLFRLTQIDDQPVPPPSDDERSSTRRRQASESIPMVKRRAFVAGVGMAVLGAAGATYLLTREREKPRPPEPSGRNRLFRFEPATGELKKMPFVFPVNPYDDTSLLAGEGGVWAGALSLHHFDRNGTLEGTLDFDPAGGGFSLILAMTTGLNDVWITTQSGIYRIDPGDAEVLDRSRKAGIGGGEIAVGFDGVWLTQPGGFLQRLALTSGLPLVAEIEIGGLPSDVEIARGSIWVSDEFGDIVRVDPERNEEIDRKTVGGAPKALTATSDHLWVVDPDSGVVQVLDIDPFAPRKSIPVGGEPVDIGAGLDAVWVADRDGALVWLDEAQLAEAGRRDVNGPLARIAIDEEGGFVWLRTDNSPIN